MTPKTQTIKPNVKAMITSGRTMVPPNTHGIVDLKMLEAAAVWVASSSNTEWIVLSMEIGAIV
jgi:hypothetical protein